MPEGTFDSFEGMTKEEILGPGAYAWLFLKPRTIKERLDSGEFAVVGKGLYGCCEGCGKVIRINKPIIGSLHICA